MVDEDVYKRQGKNQGAEPHQKFAYPRITLSEPRFQIFTDLPVKRRAGASSGKGDGDIPLFDKGGYDKGTVLRLSLIHIYRKTAKLNQGLRACVPNGFSLRLF